MRLLLDTHAFLWWIDDDSRLSHAAREAIASGDQEVFFSAASGWEIAIKTALGRLEVEGDLKAFVVTHVQSNGFQVLPVHLHHTLAVAGLPDLHGDPFDRILVAQAGAEAMTIVTVDTDITRYPVAVLW